MCVDGPEGTMPLDVSEDGEAADAETRAAARAQRNGTGARRVVRLAEEVAAVVG